MLEFSLKDCEAQKLFKFQQKSFMITVVMYYYYNNTRTPQDPLVIFPNPHLSYNEGIIKYNYTGDPTNDSFRSSNFLNAITYSLFVLLLQRFPILSSCRVKLVQFFVC